MPDCHRDNLARLKNIYQADGVRVTHRDGGIRPQEHTRQGPPHRHAPAYHRHVLALNRNIVVVQQRHTARRGTRGHGWLPLREQARIGWMDAVYIFMEIKVQQGVVQIEVIR